MLRAAVFWEESFPTVDTSPQTLDGLRRALEGLQVDVLGDDGLYRLPEFDLLVLPFGSAFPRSEWPEILIYLQAGGNLLYLGGHPFSVPCVRRHVLWQPEAPQVAYHRELGIRQVYPVDGRGFPRLDAAEAHPILAGIRNPARVTRVFALEMSTDPAGGQRREGVPVLYPLLYARDAGGRRTAAPVLCVDWLAGRYEGGRWVLATCDAAFAPETIRRLAFHAALGATECRATPSFACYYAREQPSITLGVRGSGTLRGRYLSRVVIQGPTGTRCTCEPGALLAGDLPARLQLPCGSCARPVGPLVPGLYTVEAGLVSEEARALAAELRIPATARPGERVHRTGFWVWDEALVSSGPRLSAGALYLHQEGSPSPVAGAAYAIQGTAGSSLLDPNPWLWDGDLRAMAEAGANAVAIELGPAVCDLMPRRGTLSESCLRALDAFVMCARRHGLLLLITLLEGAPPAWSEGHPFLDPHALAAQKELVAALVRRYARVPGLVWNLIRAPVFGDTPGGRAWMEWVASRDVGEAPGGGRSTPGRSPDLFPAPPDGLGSLDRRLFVEEVFGRWVDEMATFIRLRSPAGAITALGGSSDGARGLPGPQLHAGRVDLISAQPGPDAEHVLWGGILAKALDRPMLLDNLAVAIADEVDGRPGATEVEARNALERAAALAIGCGGAGFVLRPWAPGPSAGAAVSLRRADSTARPALAAFSALATFLWRNRHWLAGPEPEPTVMLIPYSRMMAQPDLAEAATRTCVRAFHSGCRMPLRAASEYALENLEHARLILVPSPGVLCQQAWEAILARVADGATAVLTGYADRDPYWRPCRRMAALGVAAHRQSVAPLETLRLGERVLQVEFRSPESRRADKAVVAGRRAEVIVLPHGRGAVIFCPLPLELADGSEAATALYEFAIARSGLERPFVLSAGTAPGVLVRPVTFRSALLYALVSQTDEEQIATLGHGPGTDPVEVRVPARRAVLLLVARETGRELDRYVPAP